MKGLDHINHAFFTDDSLLLGGASIRISNVYKLILHSFYNVSSALINDRKSVLYGWNVEQQAIHRIVHQLGFVGYAYWDKIKYLR